MKPNWMELRAKRLTIGLLVILLGACSPCYSAANDGDNDRMPLLAQLNQEDVRRKTNLKQSKQKREQVSPVKAIDEARVLAFVEEHQPELAKLLAFLKSKEPSQYQQAMREMSRSQQRLEGLSKRDKELHAIELELWNIRSRLRLVAAQIPVVGDAKRQKLNKELESLVKKESRTSIERLTLLRDRAQKQVLNFEQQIEKANSDVAIAKTLKSWQNRIAKQMPRENHKKSDQDKEKTTKGKK